MRKYLAVLIGGGRRISTTKLRGFLLLNTLASLRFMRRGSYRFKLEQARIGAWLSLIEETAQSDYALACAIAGLQRLIKGYGDTHERGLGNYMAILAVLEAVKAQPDPAQALFRLRDAALADEEGGALRAALQRFEPQATAA